MQVELGDESEGAGRRVGIDGRLTGAFRQDERNRAASVIQKRCRLIRQISSSRTFAGTVEPIDHIRHLSIAARS